MADDNHSPHPDRSTGTNVASKGLKLGAIGLLSSIVIGVASTAPGYSLAAVLGRSREVGTKAPAIMLVAFIPILFISYAYKSLNAETPDCGTNFTWTAKVFGPRAGWLSGWALIAADVIVMANLAEVAALYTFSCSASTAGRRLGWCSSASLDPRDDADRLARHRTVRPHAVRAARRRTDHPRVFSVVALWQGVRRHRRRPGDHAVAVLAQPGRAVVQRAVGRVPHRRVHLLGLGLGGGGQRGDHRPGGQPGRAAVLSTIVLVLTYVVVTVAAQAFAGVSEEGIGLANPRIPKTCSAWSARRRWAVGVKLLIIAVLTSAAASTQTTILPTAADHPGDGRLQGAASTFAKVHPRFQTPTVSTWRWASCRPCSTAGCTWSARTPCTT